MKVDMELLIRHGPYLFSPAVEEGVTWTTERKNYPGQLTFTVLHDDILNIEEGDAVRLKVNGQPIFYGFVFKKSCDKDQKFKVTAYDQLRYLKNKDTYVYENKTASELIKMIADDFKLQTGFLQNTGFKIASRVESNKTLFDIIQNALDLTYQNQKALHVLYDDFGKITLKNLGDMHLNLLIDEETGENYSFSSSIDETTYNRIKLTYDNDTTKKRDVYIAQHGANMNAWGVLQHVDTLQKGENGQAKADALLSLYNRKTRKLSIKNAFGDNRVRAGSLVIVMMKVGDMKVQNYMLVEKCKHEYRESQHFMTLTLRGGAFDA